MGKLPITYRDSHECSICIHYEGTDTLRCNKYDAEVRVWGICDDYEWNGKSIT